VLEQGWDRSRVVSQHRPNLGRRPWTQPVALHVMLHVATRPAKCADCMSSDRLTDFGLYHKGLHMQFRNKSQVDGHAAIRR